MMVRWMVKSQSKHFADWICPIRQVNPDYCRTGGFFCEVQHLVAFTGTTFKKNAPAAGTTDA